MDLSLKQRLLGAAVLIALAVIFVPMFISGSAPQKSAEIETSSLAIPPAPDREFQQRVLPVVPANGLPAPSASAPTAADTVASVDTAAQSQVATPGASALPDADGKTMPPASAQPDPAQPTGSNTAASTPPLKPTPGQAANGDFFVHLGLYSAGKNAQELVASLKKGGYPAFVEASEYQGKAAERVRVGPFADRAAAEAARLRIKQLKPTVPGSVVQLAMDAKGDAPASALPPGRAGGWAVQLGALKSEADASVLRDRLRNAGFPAFVDKVDTNGSTLWRVRVGPEVQREAAERQRAGIKDKLRLDGIIVTQP